jgi:periplasmic protein TonB
VVAVLAPLFVIPFAHSTAHEVHLDPKVAEGLLIHKEDPACRKDLDGIRVMGTVVMAITIDKNGMVDGPRALSGPKMLRPLALATVRKYRYKPYLLNNRPVAVETAVSIRMDCIIHTGQA